MIVEMLNNYPDYHKSSGKFALSGIGCCWREKYFLLWKKYKRTWSTLNTRIFSVGDHVHRDAVGALMTTAPSHGYEVAAAEVNIPVHDVFSGRIDCVMSRMADGERFLIDFKSCGKWAFEKAKKGEVSKTYVDQLNMYMHLLGVHKAYLLFVCKDNSNIAEHEVVYDYARAVEVEKDVQDFFNNNVFPGVIPPKCDGGDWGCPICEAQGKIANKDVKTPEGFDIMDAQSEILAQLNGGSYKDLYQDG